MPASAKDAALPSDIGERLSAYVALLGISDKVLFPDLFLPIISEDSPSLTGKVFLIRSLEAFTQELALDQLTSRL